MPKKPNKKKRLKFESLMQQAVQLHKAGRLLQALDIYKRCLEIIPDNSDALYYLGYLYHQASDNANAEIYLKRAVNNEPGNVAFLMGLSLVYEALDKLPLAEKLLSKVIKLMPDMAEAHSNYGVVLRDLGKVDSAISHLKKAIELKPDYAEAHYNLGVALADLGDKVSAEASYRTALKYRPNYANVLRNMVDIAAITAEDDDEIEQIKQLLRSNQLSSGEKIALHFSLGKILDSNAEYNEAFEHFSSGNQLKRKTISHDLTTTRKYIDECIDSFNRQFLDQCTVSNNQTELPVFIVGMPRSGTTLVEQILSCHPEVYAAGEQSLMREIRNKIDKKVEGIESLSAKLSTLSQEDLLLFSEMYLDTTKNLLKERDVSRMTDKMPLNFLYIGLIAILFPGARIIHCNRDPMDTCLSNYTQLFVRGNEFSYDLNELGEFYQEYQRLMQHWNNLLPERIFNIDYESLVSDMQNQVERLLKFIGLPWDDACLEFYKHKRAVQTASNWQVRKPVYTDSVKRWENYRDQLKPLSTMLLK